MALFLSMGVVAAQTIELAISDPETEIDSQFSGEPITLFGSISEVPSSLNQTPFDVVVTVRGPVRNRAVYRKARRAGMFLTESRAYYRLLPDTYFVLSNDAPEKIADVSTRAELRLAPMDWILRARIGRSKLPDSYDTALHDLLLSRGQFELKPNAVRFISPTFFAARWRLPNFSKPGVYTADAYLFADGVLVGRTNYTFGVRLTGFDLKLWILARNQPAVYGLLTVIIAVTMGWAGYAAFRR
ncbi:TIGR02186 family protein [Fluviibacterium sp. DFM31]|uniref:TIGR02186 family protein n=1 Tax=Meridianimarinicoccus marinus TaxID=3231483 RepID=A0ABV3LBJ0_9RHOB